MATKQQPSDNLYVTQLPVGMTEASVRDAFRHYGRVIFAKVLQAEGKTKDGKGESVALVQMSNLEEASWIVDHLNGNIPQGLSGPVQVKFANNRRADGEKGKGDGKGGNGATTPASSTASSATSRPAPYESSQGQALGGVPNPWGGGNFSRWGSGSGGGSGDDLSNLFVKGLPAESDELYLYKVFAPMGAIESVKAVKQEWGTIGFVKFMNEQEAQLCMATLNGYVLPDGHTLSISVKTSKGKGKGEGGKKGEEKGKGGKKGDGKQKQQQQAPREQHAWQQPGPQPSPQVLPALANAPSAALPAGADEHTLAAMRECM